MATGIISFVKNECAPRIKNLACGVGETLNAALVVGVAGLTGNLSLVSSLLTGGSRPLTEAAVTLEAGFGKSLGRVALNVIGTINPNAGVLPKKSLETRPDHEKGEEHYIASPGFFPAHKVPLFLYSFSKKQQELINFLNHSSWFINRQFTVRLIAPISSVLGIIGAFGTLLVGAGGLAASILTLGSKPTPNTLVYHSLKSAGYILNQIRQGILGFYRPALLSYPKPLPPVEEVSVADESEAEEVAVEEEGAQPEAEGSSKA